MVFLSKLCLQLVDVNFVTSAGEVAAVAGRAVKAFRATYRAAIAQWRTGDRDVAFPPGTWWMREFHAVNIGDSS